MAKGKKNKKNANVDVVQQVNKEEANKEQKTLVTQADSVKQEQNKNEQNTPQQAKNQITTQVPEQNVKTQDSLANNVPTQQVKDNVQNIQQQQCKNTTESVQPEKIQNVQQPSPAKQQQKPQVTQQAQKQKIPQQLNQQIKNQVQQHVQQIQQVKPTQQIVPQTCTLEQKKEPQQTEAQVLQQNIQQQKTQQKTNNIVKQQTETQVLQQNTQQQKLQQKTNNIVQQQTPITKNIDNTQLPYRQQLLDGLKLIEQVAQQYVFQNPLAHEQQAHAGSKFIQNFEPAAYHLSQRLLQQQKNTPPKTKNQQNIINKEQAQILQEIKQSTQSLQPDPLDLIQPSQDPKVSILKSYHSDSDQQQKKKSQLQSQSQANQSIKRKQSQSNRSNTSSRKSAAMLHPPQNPTYVNPISSVPTVPTVPTNTAIQPPSDHRLSQQVIQQPKNKLDFDQINRQALKQREQQWRKMQQRQLQPVSPSFHLIKPKHVQNPVIIPNAPQKLGYTNNLPIISHERHQQHKQNIKKQSYEVKQKLTQNQKLRKDIKQDNTIKKLGISLFVTGVCLGACLLGKLDKKIAAGASLAGFVTSYLAQK